MNTRFPFLITSVLAVCLAPVWTLPSLAGDTPNAVSPAARPPISATAAETQEATKEDLGFDIANGKTNKISGVYKVDPIAIGVIYEARSGSRMIPRQDLNPELAARFPYDA